MADLDKTRERGWSYAAGWSQEHRAYVARAWRPRDKPHRTPYGVMLFLHTVSAAAETIDDAARECAALSGLRDRGDKLPSNAELEYAEHVAGWRPHA